MARFTMMGETALVRTPTPSALPDVERPDDGK